MRASAWWNARGRILPLLFGNVPRSTQPESTRYRPQPRAAVHSKSNRPRMRNPLGIPPCRTAPCALVRAGTAPMPRRWPTRNSTGFRERPCCADDDVNLQCTGQDMQRNGVERHPKLLDRISHPVALTISPWTKKILRPGSKLLHGQQTVVSHHRGTPQEESSLRAGQPHARRLESAVRSACANAGPVNLIRYADDSSSPRAVGKLLNRKQTTSLLPFLHPRV